MGEEKEKIQQADNGQGNEVEKQTAESQEKESDQIKEEIKQYLQQYKMAFLIMFLSVIAIIVFSVGYIKYNWFNDYEIAIIIVTLICSTGIICQRFNVAKNLSKKQLKQLNKNIVANLVNIIALAVFTYWFFEKEVLLAYIIGIVFIIINISSIVKTFLSKDSALKKLLPFDIIVPIVITICLLWLLEDEKLQDIVTTIVASLFGGFLTLVGVAWTIKRQDEIRKEEEKKKAKPYLRLLDTYSDRNTLCKLKWSDFEKVQWFENTLTIDEYFTLRDNKNKLIAIKAFEIELLSDNLCKIIGFEINNTRLNLKNVKILIKNNMILFYLTDIIEVSEIRNANLIACDIYDRSYSYKVELEFDEIKRFERVKAKNIENESAYFEDGLSYNVYKIVYIGMPEEIEKEGK